MEALVDLITIKPKEVAHKKKEELLLCEQGLSFNIKTGIKKEISFDRGVSDLPARFQINRKFYGCGGMAELNGEEEPIADFFSIDYCGKSVTLQPMHH